MQWLAVQAVPTRLSYGNVLTMTHTASARARVLAVSAAPLSCYLLAMTVETAAAKLILDMDKSRCCVGAAVCPTEWCFLRHAVRHCVGASMSCVGQSDSLDTLSKFANTKHVFVGACSVMADLTYVSVLLCCNP